MSGQDLARSFLDAIATDADEPNATPPSSDRPLRIATVDPAYTGTGNPKLTFDGELILTAKAYPYLGATPVASQRVVLAPLGRSYVILTGDLGHALQVQLAAFDAAITALNAKPGPEWQRIKPTSPAGCSVSAAGLVTFSGVTALSFQYASAAYEDYQFVWEWDSIATASNVVQFLLRTAAGANIGTNYRRYYQQNDSSGAAPTKAATIATSFELARASTTGGAGTLELRSPNSARFTTATYHGVDDDVMIVTGGRHQLGTPYPGLAATCATNMAGRLQVFGRTLS